jgi:hypothetical protein
MNKKKVKAKKATGKNIRVSEDGWELLRSYCSHKGFVLGTFVENAALSKVPNSFRESASK